jgi:hypothetical protein
MLYGLITLLSDGHQRIAIASTSLLFIISMWVLSKINWQEAERQAALDRKSL